MPRGRAGRVGQFSLTLGEAQSGKSDFSGRHGACGQFNWGLIRRQSVARVLSAEFSSHVASNSANRAILSRWDLLDLPDAWLVAGCLFQTVWNVQAGLNPESGIKDYDIFYYDSSDLTDTAEAEVQALTEWVLNDLGVTVEVANQARVHLWYPEYFGYAYPALASAEEGINRFLVLETCVGVRPHQCHAPYGLCGLYAGTLTPNPLTPYPALFAKKVASYQARWNWLRRT